MKAYRRRVPLLDAGMALPLWGIILALLLLGSAIAAEAHPAMGAAAGLDGAVSGPGPSPSLASAPATSGAWTWVLLLALPGIAAMRRPRAARGLALVVASVLAVFACETAIHSVHHLKEPRQAERCPVYSASQQLSGLTATLATPVLPQPLPTLDRPVVQAVPLRSRVRDGEQSRAPPVLPA